MGPGDPLVVNILGHLPPPSSPHRDSLGDALVQAHLCTGISVLLASDIPIKLCNEPGSP